MSIKLYTIIKYKTYNAEKWYNYVNWITEIIIFRSKNPIIQES